MSISSINHINIKAPALLLKQCRDFYIDIVGLRVGYRPDFNDQGYWLYGDAKEAVIHMSASEDRVGGPSYYDHVAFNCSDLAGMQQRLRDLSMTFFETSTPDGKCHQIFLRDPCNLAVELNFKL